MWSKRTHVLSLPFSAACRSASSFSDSLYFPLIFLSLVHSLSSHLAQRAENYYRYVSVLTTVNNKAHTHSQTTPNHSILSQITQYLKLSHQFHMVHLSKNDLNRFWSWMLTGQYTVATKLKTSLVSLILFWNTFIKTRYSNHAIVHCEYSVTAKKVVRHA